MPVSARSAQAPTAAERRARVVGHVTAQSAPIAPRSTGPIAALGRLQPFLQVLAEHDGGSFGLVRLVGVRDSPGTPRAQDALGSDGGWERSGNHGRSQERSAALFCSLARALHLRILPSIV